MKNSSLVTPPRRTRLPEYRERLVVPLRWWVQGVMFVATLWLALVVAVPGLWAWSATAAVLALMALSFVAYGSASIEVVPDTGAEGGGYLRAGRARVEAAYLGTVEALDAEATRRTAGRDADARAFLLLRPYLRRSVKVEIRDAADPTPYWLLCTRHPESLAAALSALAAVDRG